MMADYGTAGVWDHDGAPLDSAKLPLSPGLRARLARWCDRFQASLDREIDLEAFATEGRAIARAVRCGLASAAARERRQRAHRAVPPCTRRGAVRLYRCRRHRRGPQGLSISHQPGPQRHHADRATDDADRCLTHDPPSRPASLRRLAITRFGRRVSPPISATDGRLSTHNQWLRTRVRARQSSMTGRRNG